MSSGESEAKSEAENMCLEFYQEQDGTTMVCTRPAGHEGRHRENPTVGKRSVSDNQAVDLAALHHLLTGDSCRELYLDPDEQTTMICTLPIGHDGEHFDERAQGEKPPAPSSTPAETARQLERQGFLQHERTVNKIALFFRKHYQREMREGRHAGMTMDQCVIHYLQRERAVPGWIKEWCLRVRGGK
jgi:hypothetical protein